MTGQRCCTWRGVSSIVGPPALPGVRLRVSVVAGFGGLAAVAGQRCCGSAGPEAKFTPEPGSQCPGTRFRRFRRRAALTRLQADAARGQQASAGPVAVSEAVVTGHSTRPASILWIAPVQCRSSSFLREVASQSRRRSAPVMSEAHCAATASQKNRIHGFQFPVQLTASSRSWYSLRLRSSHGESVMAGCWMVPDRSSCRTTTSRPRRPLPSPNGCRVSNW